MNKIANKLVEIIILVKTARTAASAAPVPVKAKRQIELEDFFVKERFGCHQADVKKLVGLLTGYDLKQDEDAAKSPPIGTVLYCGTRKVPWVVLRERKEEEAAKGFAKLDATVYHSQCGCERLATDTEFAEFVASLQTIKDSELCRWSAAHNFELPNELLEVLDA